MTEHRPHTPGDWVRDVLLSEGVSQAELADAMAVPRQTVSAMIAGARPITADLALRLEIALGGTAELWLNLQRCVDLAAARERLRLLNPRLRRVAVRRRDREREDALYRQDAKP